MNALSAAGEVLLELTRDLVRGASDGPLAELALLQGLTHTSLRDAFIAQLLGHDATARDLLAGRTASMQWIHQRPSADALRRAHQVIDHLLPLADRCGGEPRTALVSVRALLLWLDNRPLEARFTLRLAAPGYPLAAAIAGMIAAGYVPADGEATS